MTSFAGKTIFVAGAACSLGERLLPVFVDQQARVILMDQDSDRLQNMAMRAPNLIEHLPIRLLSLAQIRQLGAIWDEEPLHLLINLLPMRRQDPEHVLAGVSLALIEALHLGLKSARGAAINVVPQAHGADDIGFQMAESALRKMSAALAETDCKCAVRFHLIRPHSASDENAIVQAISWINHRDASDLTGVEIPIGSPAD
ncbi:hypothetical protein NBRC116601_09440 [Cognatishimia sp. WU-CL00825]|uniref:hypothetical protein n=1 Tax=Cognatishimia sp. WU-CL00825 TaxID=3127658 RepID=UPI0031041683